MYNGAIEAGGTKFVCAIGTPSGEIVDKVTLPTTGPEETLQKVVDFFAAYQINRLGVGSFGPIDLNKDSNTYGTILNTPKQLWKGYDLLGALQRELSVPVYLDTDVNAAALGEYRWGAAQGARSVLYITVGTGIGAGFVKDGRTFIGRQHPEMGHIKVEQHPEDRFTASCPYHGNCLEGLASGTAIHDRYGRAGTSLPENDPVWEMTAYYLAQAIVNYSLVLAPEQIILGGGVMKQERLYELIRNKVSTAMNGYMDLPVLEEYITAPALLDEQGIKGALALIPADTDKYQKVPDFL
ncbi:fructokinase [Thalassobacillus devorans]|uniref:fructokinase n=1 Tax=Thalassobacillus devorans TaxID=279813 RepID=A0ABQ1NUM0_9BACI|nr:ROK family protein [Thalassobacillus devorans]NIK28587.1 fructokinase [Thalassobacillus devorans]GGC85057.1 fructokinase [Thalassobacillus devorans]